MATRTKGPVSHTTAEWTRDRSALLSEQANEEDQCSVDLLSMTIEATLEFSSRRTCKIESIKFLFKCANREQFHYMAMHNGK